jgi:RNase P subunit RPR2
MTIAIKKVEDGVAVQVGKQSWLGIAASLGTAAFWAIRNPFNLLGRLDDIAQDLESLQLSERVWEVINRTASRIGASYELSERLRRIICDYCNTPNPVGASSCIACGGPLGNVQPITCQFCGFVVRTSESNCPNCKRPL